MSGIAGSLPAGRSILSNFLWSAFYVFLARGIRFAAIAYCVRVLGAEGWGQVVSTFVIVGFLNLAVDQGLNLVPSLHRLGDTAMDGVFLRKITAYRSSMAILVIVGTHVWNLIQPLDPLIPLFTLALLPRAWNLDWWFQRQNLYRFTMAIGAAKVAVFAGCMLAFLWSSRTAVSVVYAELASEFAGAALGFILFRRHRGPTAPVATGPILGYLQLVRLGQPLLLIGLLNTVHQSIDVVFLKHLCGYGVVGEYDVGYKIGFFLFFLGATIIQIIRPRLTRMGESGVSSGIGGILDSVSKLLSCMAASFMVFSFYFSDFAIGLIFGQRTELTRFVFQWAPLWVATAFMTMLCADTLLSLGMKGKYLQGALLCALVNVAGNIVLIKAFGGYGSLFATLLAEMAFFAYSFSLLPAEIRSCFSRTLAVQAAIYAALIAIYVSLGRSGSMLPAFGLSLLCLGLLFRIQNPLKKSSLAVLRAG
jgi:O-antigen/teichoic acid export membrane protein